MAKGALALHKEIRKKEHAKTRLGKLEKELWKFYDNRHNKDFFVDEDGTVNKMNKHLRWVDIHRATTVSRQKDLEIEAGERIEAIRKEFEEKTDELLCEQMQKELDYLTELQHAK